MPPVVSIVGKSNSGKTTLIEKLLPVLKVRGYRIAVIKHAHHGFDMDRRGKDSYRHKAAGADAVIVASPQCVAIIKDGTAESVQQLLPYLGDMDLILTEGFKRESLPKIEVLRKERGGPPICAQDPHLVGMVSDMELDLSVPMFGLEQVEELADFIESRFLKGR